MKSPELIVLATIQSELKKEMICLAILLIVEIMLLKIIFYKESLYIVIKLSLSLFWLFILPGFMIAYLFAENLNFIERLIAGIVTGMAFFGVIGYNLGVIGLPFKYQIWVLPLAGIIIGLVSLIKNKRISF